MLAAEAAFAARDEAADFRCERAIPADEGSAIEGLGVAEIYPPLTRREKQLLRRLARGMTDAGIANDIGGTTTKQIEAQRTRLLNRLGISTIDEIREAARSLVGTA
jgi:DNA-binding NarL/FixJ family response regulator